MFIMLREVPTTSPRRPDTGALFPYRLIIEDLRRVIYGDTAEDLARAICGSSGYPKAGMPRDLVTFELMSSARRRFAVRLANQAQGLLLASLEAEMPIADRKLSSWAREALYEDRAVTPRRPMLLWPRTDVALILVASSFAPVTARARTLGAVYIDDLDDLSLLHSASALLGWRLDTAKVQERPGESDGAVGGQGSDGDREN
jgi:hypothetical protein